MRGREILTHEGEREMKEEENKMTGDAGENNSVG
jgi:hypothetical protein